MLRIMLQFMYLAAKIVSYLNRQVGLPHTKGRIMCKCFGCIVKCLGNISHLETRPLIG